MRLIDADKLCRELSTVDERYESEVDWFIRILNAEPTIDAVEVVRCKDCKFYEPFTPSIGRCHEDVVTLVKNSTDYCSYGERKNDEE